MSAERLIEELMHNAQVAAGRPLERRLADLTVWYYKNKQQISPLDVQKRTELLERAFWISLEVNALLAERLHELEGMGKSQHLWTPRGMMTNGKEFR